MKRVIILSIDPSVEMKSLAFVAQLRELKSISFLSFPSHPTHFSFGPHPTSPYKLC